MTKEIGTLAEIGAKVGDVVEWTYNGRTEVLTDKKEKFWTANDYRIIRRASSGPVREVTRKEIVPGVYGRVCIGEKEGDTVMMKLANRLGKPDHVTYHFMTAAELTAAIDTLTQIRDAMQEGGE
jgi:ribosomal protein S28E/S33